MPPGAKLVSDAGAEFPVHGPLNSLIRREIASPPVGTKMLRAPTSKGSLHKWGPKTKPSESVGSSLGESGLGVRVMNSLLNG